MTTTDDIVRMTHRTEDERDFATARHSHRRLKAALKRAATPRPLPTGRCCGRCRNWRQPDAEGALGQCTAVGVAAVYGWNGAGRVEKGQALPTKELARAAVSEWDLMRSREWFAGCGLFAPALGTEDPLKGSFRIVFDGGAKPNPGRGYGSYRIERLDKPASLIERIDLDPPVVTNNEAEYLTLIRALQRLGELSNAKGRAHVEIVGDSKLVINQITGDWHAGDPRMQALCGEARGLLDDIGTFSARWQRRDDTVAILGH